MTENQGMRLPDNAKTPLKPGERYIPLIPDESTMLEVTLRSVVMGSIMTAIFSLVAAYLAMKVGQGIEAAIPIAILAIGMGKVFSRKSTLLENVIIQSIGANSSHVVAGAVFTIPALYMFHAADPSFPAPAWYTVALTAFLGGSFGIAFLSPLRYYFMEEEHGKLPWPEATATTEILLSSEASGGQAIVLVVSTACGFIYELLGQTLHAFKDMIEFTSVGVFGMLGKSKVTGEAHTLGTWLGEEHFMAMRVNNLAAIVGVGYIIGLKYAAIICAGSFTSYFVLIPFVHAFASFSPETLIIAPSTVPLADMSIDEIFLNYVRMIGIGGIAGAGVIGIISAFPSMLRSIMIGMKGMGHSGTDADGGVPRTSKTLSMGEIGIALLLLSVGALLFFKLVLGITWGQAFIGWFIVIFFAFLFAPVSARAIAIVGTNPVSGMTLMTLIITAVVFASVGLEGPLGMTVALVVGGTVCTALAAAGALSSDLKIGHWIGATPRNQLGLKFLGTLIAALFCALAMWLLSDAYVLGSTDFPCPQASAMKEIIGGLMGPDVDAGIRWKVFGLGVVLAVILRIVGIPGLAFALGMYLPIQLNVPVMIGGFIAYMVSRKRASEGEVATKAGYEKGILIASGLIAGGGLLGILDAVLASTGVKEHLAILPEAVLEHEGEWASIAFLVGLCLFIYYYARSGAKTAPGGPAPDEGGGSQ